MPVYGSLEGIRDTMYPTPLYSHVGQAPFSDVYVPAEDTFILIDALERDAEELKKRTGICLEVGSGSGLVSTFLATVIGPKAFYLCTDINPEATACIVETALRNSVHIQPLITDLVKGLLLRLHGIVDLLVFNPPYVITPSEEVGSPGIAAAWAGGKEGREVMDRFFPFVPHLLSEQGVFYLVTLKENNPDDIVERMKKCGLFGTVALSRQAGRERLHVLKFIRSASELDGSLCEDARKNDDVID
ncbi:methyltransferase N6AMT1 isoform X3 [Ambystoma mexicanum]|uniref:methyltransferase N6AMT1 isoform X3 n=1 Tax=Ambystoma mexicanum TaxID=8296 RepID=UPI0037E8AD93